MAGLGENIAELLDTFRDIAETGCDILTVGQYLAPTPKHIPIERYYTPDEFAYLKSQALAMGFRYVEAGPLVRSCITRGAYARRRRPGSELQQGSGFRVLPIRGHAPRSASG